MVRFFSAIALFFAFCCAPAFAAGLPMDDYLGDSSIYVGVPNQRPKPNVLLLIDTSQATLGRSAGSEFKPANNYGETPYISNRIYYSDQQGGFSPNRPLGGNSPVLLTGVSCSVSYQAPDNQGVNQTVTVDVQSKLQDFGTYSGSGSARAPNLDRNGACTTAPQGAVYATGKYLNYLATQTVVVGQTMIIRHSYPDGNQTKTERFELVRNLPNPLPSAPAACSTAGDYRPGVGSCNGIYWSKLPNSDQRKPTHEIISGALVPVPDNPPNNYNYADGWSTTLLASYYLTSLDPTIPGTAENQRQAFYNALAPVIRGASDSVNFGFLTYNPQNQGAELTTGAGIRERLSSADVEAFISLLPRMQGGNLIGPPVVAAGPQRPSSEALYDAGHYFRAVYRAKATDAALNATSQKVNNQMTQIPTPNPCGYNHIIYLTNGLPNQDTGIPSAFGDWDNDGSNESDYGLGSHWLDDIAYFLKNKAVVNGVPNGEKNPGITTHVILAFQAADTLLERTASNGGGAFYNVFNTEGLTNSLQEILTNIVSESNTAFVAPVVPASSTNRTLSSNRVYLGLFKPQSNAPWHGNLKKYKVSTGNQLLDVYGHRATDTAGDFIYSQSYWGTNSAGQILSAEDPFLRNAVSPSYNPDTGTPDPNGGDGGIVDAGGVGGTLMARDFSSNPRKIYTYLTPANSTVTTANVNLTNSQNTFALTNANITGVNTFRYADETKRDQLIRYVHGFDAFTSGRENFKRNWILGDILHSKPLVFNYGKYLDTTAIEGTCYPSNSTTFETLITHSPNNIPFNTSFIFLGANDGMMHAFRDCDGEEVWAFIPPMLLEDLKHLPEVGHEYMVDGAPSTYVHDYDGDGNIEPGDGDAVILIFGLRRGGGNAFLTPNDPRGAYYALDVTDPLNPKFMWEIKGGGDSSNPYYEMGETWSQPRLAKIKDGTVEKVAMFVGAGYDNNEDRRWGATQNFPSSSWTNDGNFDNDTNTTIPTNDGDPGINHGGVTSATNGTQLNPKGRGLYVVEVATLIKDANNKYDPSFGTPGNPPTLIWAYIHGETNTTTNNDGIATNSNLTFSIPSDLTVLDWDDDGYADRVYVGDTGGRMWRFSLPLTLEDNVRKGIKGNWTADIIFASNPGSDNTNGRKFFYRPSVARAGNYAMLYFGSGDREHPLNLAVTDRMYMLFDRGQGLSQIGNFPGTDPPVSKGVKTESNLLDVTANTLQEASGEDAPNMIETIMAGLNAPSNFGWYIKLDEHPGEKMLAPSIIFFGQAFFTTYAPLLATQNNCEVGNLGTSRLYHLDYRTGEAVYNYVADNTQTAPEGNTRANKEGVGLLLRADRVRTLGEGIPSGIVTLMDASGKVTMMISASNRVGTYSAPDVKLITPVYWMQWNN